MSEKNVKITKNLKVIDYEEELRAPLATSQTYYSIGQIEEESNLKKENSNLNTVVQSKTPTPTAISTEVKIIDLSQAASNVPNDETNIQNIHLNNLDVKRETWSKKFDFLMSIIGFSVDLASIWRLNLY